MRAASTVRLIELTQAERALMRRLVRHYAAELGYGDRYHTDDGFPGGPRDWPEPLRRLNTLMRKLHEHRHAGGIEWPDDSPPSATATAPAAKR